MELTEGLPNASGIRRGRPRAWRLVGLMLLLAASLQTPAAEPAPAPFLPRLVELLLKSDDPSFQLDLLRGLNDAFRGQRQIPMPPRWEEIERRFTRSTNPEIESLTQLLSLTFGSARAVEALKAKVENPSVPSTARRRALEALLAVREPSLPPLLIRSLNDPEVRSVALRGLASYDNPETAQAILAAYPRFTAAEKRDALNTLASRISFAKALLEAMANRAIPRSDLSPDVLRQLRNLKSPELAELLEKTWGVARESGSDKKAEIDRYRNLYWAGGSQPGDASRGRAVFSRICQQCHTLFETGGKVGPDLTGSNRSDVDYILQNIVDPNAVIPNEYRSWTLETKDDRLLTGIVKEQDDKTVTIVTANETLAIPRGEIKTLQQSELSMMPEGLIAQLADQEIRDLIYYLGRPGQVPLPAGTPPLGGL